MNWHRFRMGRRAAGAAQLLVSLLAGEPARTFAENVPELMIRASTAGKLSHDDAPRRSAHNEAHAQGEDTRGR
ncbi:hypothetical protein VRY54_02605 [Actinomyces sp. F1_1611]